MDNLLVAAGIAIIVFILWRDWAKEQMLLKEKEDGRKLLGELADARREVQILLGQLETVSEKIVDEISYGLEEIKTQVSTAIEKTDEPEDNVTQTPVKIKISKQLKRSNKSGADAVSLTSGKTVSPKTPKHQLVYAMADMGHTEEDIAKQMKIGKGEVSLLLQLRRRGEEDNV